MAKVMSPSDRAVKTCRVLPLNLIPVQRSAYSQQRVAGLEVSTEEYVRAT